MRHSATPTTVERLRDALQRPLPGLPAQIPMAPAPRPGTVHISELDWNCRRAGVLVLLYPHAGELCLVLTRRTESLESHRGQISFPGGGLLTGESVRQAALREAEEELCVAPAELDLVGDLSPLYIPASGYCIYPLVAFASRRPDFLPNPHEVAEVIEAPLSQLLDPATRCEETWPWQDTCRRVPFYAIGEHKVWGATAMVLCELLTLIGENPAPRIGGQRAALPPEVSMKAIILHEHGGPEVLKLEDRPTPEPGPGQALLQIAATGVNFIEIYQREGRYKLPLPCGIGGEGAGTVIAIGPGVTEVKVGERVAWLDGANSYATHTVVPAAKLAPVPAGVTLEQAAAAMVQGLTADVLTSRTYAVKPGDRALVHAAAGGAGRMLCQIAVLRGATVIGTVSSEAKAQVARAGGAAETIIYTEQDFEAEVMRITGGRGVNVVYDSVGKDTFDKSLACLAPLGHLVLFGQSSGFVPPFDLMRLSRGSLTVTRPIVFHYVATRTDLLRHAAQVLGWIGEGKLSLLVDRTYSLDQAAEAHIALASRQTTGKLLLIP